MQPPTQDIDRTPEEAVAPEIGAPKDEIAENTEIPDGSDDQGLAWYADSLVWAIFLGALAADQITKAIITSTLRRGESWPDDGFVQATYARNTGTAFGLFRDQGFALTIISLVAVAGMIYFFRGTALRSWPMRLSIAIMLGGAIGNLTDRIRLGFVVDFIDIGPWPIFNLADSFITTGIAILVITTMFFPDQVSNRRDAQSNPQGDAQSNPENDPADGVTPGDSDALARPEDLHKEDPQREDPQRDGS